MALSLPHNRKGEEHDMKYYLAYGSNLSVRQMLHRCPDAVYVGTAEIPDYQMLFKGSKTGNYLTIEPNPGCRVPVVVWKISDSDERCLDVYEGYPRFYYKAMMQVTVYSLLDGRESGTVEALVYIMHEDRELGCPTGHYFDVCLEGYQRFGFDPAYLGRALADSIGRKAAKRFLEQS